MRNRTDIVVTGIGVLSSVGTSREEFWDALTAGRSGVRPIRAYDAADHPVRIASEVDFDPADFIPRRLARKMARVSQLASCAAVDAVRDAGLDLEAADPLRVGCVIGSAAGDHEQLAAQHLRFAERGPGSVSPMTVPKVIPNMPASNVGIALGIHGPNLGVTTACATGAHAIGAALDLLRAGRADVVLAGGAESTITPFVVEGYAAMKVLSRRNDEPERASRPFDADRDGFVIGEGAGVLVLEPAAHARARGARPLARVVGFGMSADAYSIAAPVPDGRWAAAAIEAALRDADLAAEDIGYVNAHGTSTKVNDEVEAAAVRRVFGDRPVPVSSTKSMIGHTLGAAGAVEAAATVLALHHGVLPPTINHDTPDPAIDLDVVPNAARPARISAALSNGFGFGGQNGVLAFTEA